MDRVLDTESYEDLLAVRRDVYIGGGIGFLFGSFTCASYHGYKLMKSSSPKLSLSNKNIMLGSLLLCATGGSFLGAQIAGKYSTSRRSKYKFLRENENDTEYIQLQKKNANEILQNNDASHIRRYESITANRIVEKRDNERGT